MEQYEQFDITVFYSCVLLILWPTGSYFSHFQDEKQEIFPLWPK